MPDESESMNKEISGTHELNGSEGFEPLIRDWLDHMIMSQMTLPLQWQSEMEPDYFHNRLADLSMVVSLGQRVGGNWQRWFEFTQNYVKDTHQELSLTSDSAQAAFNLRCEWVYFLARAGMLESAQVQLHTLQSQLVGVETFFSEWEKDKPITLTKVQQYPAFDQANETTLHKAQIFVATKMYERGWNLSASNLVKLTEEEVGPYSELTSIATVAKVQALTRHRGQMNKIYSAVVKQERSMHDEQGEIIGEMVPHTLALIKAYADAVFNTKGMGAACAFFASNPSYFVTGLEWMVASITHDDKRKLNRSEIQILEEHIIAASQFISEALPELQLDILSTHCQLLVLYGHQKLARNVWSLLSNEDLLIATQMLELEPEWGEQIANAILLHGVLKDEMMLLRFQEVIEGLHLSKQELDVLWRGLALGYAHTGNRERALWAKGQLHGGELELLLEIDFFVTRLFLGEVDDLEGEIRKCLRRVQRIDRRLGRLQNSLEESDWQSEVVLSDEEYDYMEESFMIDYMEYFWRQVIFFLKDYPTGQLKPIWNLVEMKPEQVVRVVYQLL